MRTTYKGQFLHTASIPKSHLKWNNILKFINFTCSLRLCNHLTYSILSRNMYCPVCPFVPHHALTSKHKHASSTNYCNWHYGLPPDINFPYWKHIFSRKISLDPEFYPKAEALYAVNEKGNYRDLYYYLFIPVTALKELFINVSTLGKSHLLYTCSVCDYGVKMKAWQNCTSNAS